MSGGEQQTQRVHRVGGPVAQRADRGSDRDVARAGLDHEARVGGDSLGRRSDRVRGGGLRAAATGPVLLGSGVRAVGVRGGGAAGVGVRRHAQNITRLAQTCQGVERKNFPSGPRSGITAGGEGLRCSGIFTSLTAYASLGFSDRPLHVHTRCQVSTSIDTPSNLCRSDGSLHHSHHSTNAT